MIVVTYGSDIIKTTIETLEASDIGTYLKPTDRVAIKPNLVVARPANGGATTHPEVVEGIILFLQAFGVRDIQIIEGSWVGDCTKRAYKACGYEALSKKYNIPLFDLKDDSYEILSHEGYEVAICDSARNTDFLINVPVLKGHCQTRLTCCMKNLKGCIPDREKSRFHTQGLHEPIAVLNALLKPGYNVVDGICGDLNFEEGGTPIESNRIIAGRDSVQIDTYCAQLMGYEPDEIGYLAYAKDMGIGERYTAETTLIERNVENKPATRMKRPRAVDKYKPYIEEDGACSACYSALIYALYRFKKAPVERIYIGQGFCGKTGKGLGIGKCARGFDRSVAGCPPKATDILRMLK